MGFLDNAKNKLSASFGEETVKLVQYKEDKQPKDKMVKQQKEKLEKPKRQKVEKKPKPVKNKPEKNIDDDYEELELSKGANTKKKYKEETSRQKPIKPTRPQKEEPIEDEVEEETIIEDNEASPIEENIDEEFNVDYDEDDEDELPFDEEELLKDVNNNKSKGKESVYNGFGRTSVFDVDDDVDDFFTQKQKEYDEKIENEYSDIPDLQVSNNKIQDVLEVLQIPPTFAIETDIFLPEDIQRVSFNYQKPYGYDEGEVELFVERTRNTVQKYVELLKLRNEHVAKIASVVDKLQVDLNNMKYEKEIANGINIMPSSNSEDVEAKLFEAKLEIKQLKDKVKTLSNEPPKLSNKDKALLDSIKDEISILRRENEELKEENYSIKNQLAVYEEEESDYTEEFNQIQDDLNSDYVDENNDMPNLGKDDVVDNNKVQELDDYNDVINDEPSIEIMDEDNNIQEHSAFDLDDEDEIDQIMKEWK